jgi:hypothetical protein
MVDRPLRLARLRPFEIGVRAIHLPQQRLLEQRPAPGAGD